jgi:hypothetical protein
MRWILAGLLAASWAAAGLAYAEPYAPPEILFDSGRFAEARAAFESVPQTAPNYQVALRTLGTIALYENRLDDADRLLRAALARDPKDMQSMGLLAELANRQGKFADATVWLNKLGKSDRAAEFALFGNSTPYRMPAGSPTTAVAFTQTDPLPAVTAKINGHEGLFLIDTGAGEVVLDPDFAISAGVQMAGKGQGTPAAGKTAALSFGRIAKLSLSSLDIEDVPAVITSVEGFSTATTGKKIAGVIGTELLSRFVTTIDYPGGKLVLAPRDKPAPMSAGVVAVPFTLVGDHFLLARGKLDDGKEQLFMVDTSLTGFAFTAPASTLDDSKIPPPKPGDIKLNVAGHARVASFPIATLSLGNLQQQKLIGLYGPFPLPLEEMLGVHVGGIVTHTFFRPYAITFDFGQMKLLVRKPI